MGEGWVGLLSDFLLGLVDLTSVCFPITDTICPSLYFSLMVRLSACPFVLIKVPLACLLWMVLLKAEPASACHHS